MHGRNDRLQDGQRLRRRTGDAVMADTRIGRSDEVSSRSSRDHELVLCTLSFVSRHRICQHDPLYWGCLWGVLLVCPVLFIAHAAMDVIPYDW